MKLNTAPSVLAALATPLLLASCDTKTEAPTFTAELALARSIMDACPLGAPNDAQARNQCADNLAKLETLRNSVADPILWGGQPMGKPLSKVIDEASLTDLNPYVWRKMYLSTFMFEGEPTAELAGEYVAVHLPVRFRNMLEPGQYPYPFWHSEKKWKSYETAVEVLLFFKDGKIIGGARSEVTDPSRSHVEHVWDGAWTWSDGQEPRAALYGSIFSPMNPHITRLDEAYRNFSAGLRQQTCLSCHSPDNAGMAQHLELLNYPNQALSGRHDLLAVLEENIMPPGSGVADQVVRLDLIRLASEFAEAGDEALAFEGEPIPSR